MQAIHHVQLHIFCSARPALASFPPILCRLLKLSALRQDHIPYLSAQCDRSCPPTGFVLRVIYKLQIPVQSVMLVELQWKL